MSILLVRHAHALRRHDWTADDDLRPLSPKGFAQADALVAVLRDHRIDTISSSPALRCTQTVAPLAGALGLTVVENPLLAEGTPNRPVRRLVDELEHAVLCSHGDVIPELVDHLIAEGMEAVGRDCKKASVWILERDGPTFRRGTYLPPPDVEGG